MVMLNISELGKSRAEPWAVYGVYRLTDPAEYTLT